MSADPQWYPLPGEDAQAIHPAAFEAWVHPAGATLVLLYEATADDPSVGCWVWQLDTEHDLKSQCSASRTAAPFGWAMAQLT